MTLKQAMATEQDAEQIAAVHMAAFGSNAMLCAQFPTPASRQKLKLCITQKALDDIRDPKIAVTVVRDPTKVISFAKWSLPVLESETYEESPWIWPDDTDFEVLSQWTEKVEFAKQKILGNAPCYRLSFLGTDPAHERRGAASLLLKWGLDRCTRDGVSAYLEGTVDAGPLYYRHGFKAAGNISMTLKQIGNPVIYEETCFLYTPGGAS